MCNYVVQVVFIAQKMTNKHNLHYIIAHNLVQVVFIAQKMTNFDPAVFY